MADCVLDSSAVLALMKREPGSEIVENVISGSVASAVNVAEVVAKLIDWGDSAENAQLRFGMIGLAVVEVDERLAIEAGLLRQQTRHLGLSLGDRFCLALGRKLALPVYTADRNWMALSPSIDIRLIR